MEWSQRGLSRLGFTGWLPFRALEKQQLPPHRGVYVVCRLEHGAPPELLSASVGGPHKGNELTLPLGQLRDAWIEESAILYIGKAGSSGGIRERLWAYAQQGRGNSAGHFGGRRIWQLEGSEQLLVAWMESGDVSAEDLERSLLRRFLEDYGRRPFANMTGGQQVSLDVATGVIESLLASRQQHPSEGDRSTPLEG